MSEVTTVDDGRLTTAAKTRPETWSQLVGQSHAVDVLTSIIRGRRESPGYLLSGPTGTGKTSAACLLGIALSCEHRGDSDIDACESCRANIKELDTRRPHILWFSTLTCTDSDIDAQVKKLIDSRDLREGRGYLALGRIVVLLDEAHALPRDTQDKLLAELEAPDARGGVILLATNEPEALLPTLRDRCTDARFVALGHDHLREIAERHCAEFGYSPDEEMLAEVVIEADESGRNLTKLLRERALYSSSGSTMPQITELIHAIVMEDMPATAVVLDRMERRAQFDPGLILKSIVAVWHGALLRKLDSQAPGHFYERFRELQVLLMSREGDRLRREVALVAEITRREASSARTRLTIEALIAELLFRDDLDTKLERIETQLSKLTAALSQ